MSKSKNQEKIYLKMIGALCLFVVLLVTSIVVFVISEILEAGLLVLISSLYCLYRYIYLRKILKNSNYIELEATCVDTKLSKLGYSLTNSVIFVFEIKKPEQFPNNDRFIELQVNVTPAIDEISVVENHPVKIIDKVSTKQRNKYPYKIGNTYLLMFQNKKANEQQIFNNATFLNGTIYEYSVTEQEDESSGETIIKNEK